MKFGQVRWFVFASCYFQGSYEVVGSIFKEDTETIPLLSAEESSQSLIQSHHTRGSVKMGEGYDFHGKELSTEEDTQACKAQRNLFFNYEKNLKLSPSYKSMEKSMNLIKESEFFKFKPLCHQKRDRMEVLSKKLAAARKMQDFADLHRLNDDHQQALKSLMYAQALQRLLKIFKPILERLEKVHGDISIISRNQLRRSAGRAMGQSCSTDGKISEAFVSIMEESKIKDVVKELNRVLHELKDLSTTLSPLKDEKELCLPARVLFETYIFQALSFLYEKQLCDQKVLKTFFSTENTLERTYEHLRDLFKRRKQKGKVSYFTLMPELSFVLNDWNTAHLHNLLRDLEKRQQARLVELMLVGEVESFQSSISFPSSSPEFKSITTSVNEGGILKHWWREESPNPSGEAKIEVLIQQLMRFFGEAHYAKTADFMISYYLLNFIKTYQIHTFLTLQLNVLERNKLLNAKYEITTAGIRAHEALNRLSDYIYLYQLESSQKDYLTIEVTAEMIANAKMEILNKANRYKSIRQEVQLSAQEHEELSRWTKSSLFNFYDNFPFPEKRRNLWSNDEISFDKTVSDLQNIV
ncbi:hypothetical protein O181_046459 [Austropuccinia psidii MF-1]|uniref:Uncharacterized protein n=1 Tax=Austropuccinia psidii MF-1 TaxID=1389203 RepID=A0A9Q3DP50_9BASI|nr:hypothetical protein [Austropuccinia psidii MF-1]